MEAARDAARLQHRLGIGSVQVVQGALDYKAQWCCAVVYQTGLKQQIMHDTLTMCLVGMHNVPKFMQDAVWETFRSKITNVVVWLQQDRTFYDVAGRKLATARQDPEYGQLLEFRRKIEDDVETTTTFGGTWCQMRFGDAQMETSDVMPIAGTIVLCRQADRVIEEMRSELLQKAYPLYTNETRGGLRETFDNKDA